MDQEVIMRIQMMEQETNQLNEQLKSVDFSVAEMNDLKESLEEIESNENKEIMVNLGKRIFIPVKISDKKLIVEVGKGNFVKKSVIETKLVVDEESEKLNEAKIHIMGRLEELQEEMNQMIMEFQKEQMNNHNKEHAKAGEGSKKGHVHGPDCDHEDSEKEASIEDLAEGK